jgi:hypothetical protein
MRLIRVKATAQTRKRFRPTQVHAVYRDAPDTLEEAVQQQVEREGMRQVKHGQGSWWGRFRRVLPWKGGA